MMFSRRDALRGLAGVGAALVLPQLNAQQNPLMEKGTFTLPPLPYAPDALEPHIDAQTMTIHHDRHHNTYVTNLNAAVAKHESLKGKTIEELLRDIKSAPSDVQTAIRNSGGGHLNHTLFWNMMKKGGGQPSGELASAINKSFGSMTAWQDQFTQAATTRFGSGWAWLVKSPDGQLKVVSTANQDNPIMDNMGTPLLGLDVWEHAYYLKYQNKRPDYIKAWFNVVNWDFVASRYSAKS